MNKLIIQYLPLKNKIQSRLKEFKKLQQKDYYNEFLFCLITPQSNAQRCWQAILQISKLKNPTHNQILYILKTKTRFHNTKAKRLLNAPNLYKEISPLLSNPDKLQLRNTISQKVNGYGLKEASHFLRNIGESNNQIAILDRHILKNLHKLKIIPEPKIKSPKNYLEIEKLFLNFAKKSQIPPDSLDLLWWSQENGEIFK
jgi:N-glycosylase/DNA lyase